MRQLPDHCNNCSWFFSKMGACPVPEVSIFFSYISLLPYLIIFYLIGLTLVKRQLSIIRLSSMLVSAYIIGDKLLKNVFQSQRPPFSCKNTHGMPSSHMTVIVAVTFYLVIRKDINVLIKLGMVVLCFLQGTARVNLHYHTNEQVFGGVIFGILFAIFFFKVFDMLMPKLKAFIPSWLQIQDDLYSYTQVQNK